MAGHTKSLSQSQAVIPPRQSCGYFFACAYHACRFYLFFGRGRDTTYNTRKGKS